MSHMDPSCFWKNGNEVNGDHGSKELVNCTIAIDNDKLYDAILAMKDDIVKHFPAGFKPTVGIITGSGLDIVVKQMQNTVTIPQNKIVNMLRSQVSGHANKIVLGRTGNRDVICFVGRTHFYEGFPTSLITMPVRAMKLMGVQYLFVTNSCGGVNPSYELGDIIVLKDQINIPGLSGHHPLIGPNDDRWGTRFPHLFNAYDYEMRRKVAQICQKHRFPYKEGIYTMQSGPTYQSKAEARSLLELGIDLVGMSTCPEVIVAIHCGLKVCGMSLVASNIKYDHYEYETLPVQPGDIQEYKVTKTTEAIQHENVVKIANDSGELMGKMIAETIKIL